MTQDLVSADFALRKKECERHSDELLAMVERLQRAAELADDAVERETLRDRARRCLSELKTLPSRYGVRSF